MITYMFSAIYALEETAFESHPLKKDLNGAVSIISSEGFRNYEKCFDSFCQFLINEVDFLNENNDRNFIVMHATNPTIFPKSTTTSTELDWLPGELVKSVIIEESSEDVSSDDRQAFINISLFCQSVQLTKEFN